MPGSNERAMEKAKTLPCDAVIFDLEDAVAPDAKPEAREKVCAAVAAGGYGAREVVVRVNGLDTEWGLEDIRAAANANPDAILVPKIENGAMVVKASALIAEADADPSVGLWVMMETPVAMLRAAEIAGAGGRLECMVMGTNDLAKDLHAVQTAARTPMITSLALCMLAARAFDLTILDGVYNDIKNEDGFAAVCDQGREFGFDGKTLIHPSQLEPCNRIFSPEAQAISDAREIIEAFKTPEAANVGVLKVGGKMVERLHLEEAKRLVAIADVIAAQEVS
jgi:citrate lyase subunit beta/citryl-CoA lyase